MFELTPLAGAAETCALLSCDVFLYPVYVDMVELVKLLFP